MKAWRLCMLVSLVACSEAGAGTSTPSAGVGAARAGAGSPAVTPAGSAAAGRAGAAAAPSSSAPRAGSGAAGQPSDAGALDAAPGTTAPPSTDPPPDAGASQLITLHNGGFWNDRAGKRIEAHGGGFLHVDDTWYWVGEDKSGNSAGFKGVNIYASQDLSSWEFRRAIITRDTAPELAAADRIIERPKVTYNDMTKRYVMWLHWEGQNYAEAAAGVFSCATVDGDYEYHASFRPNNNMSRDDTLFRDDDGKAYFISAANENADLVIYELTPDYLDIARQVLVLFPGAKREAPALFKHEGRYYLITSAATGWDSNQAKYTTATSIEGPWSEMQNLGNNTTFDTQPTYVIPIVGSARTTYIYAGDRWQDPDLASSKYIWLPLMLGDAGKLSLDFYADWQIDLATGVWSVDDGFLPQGDWKLLRADSEETSMEDGRASNAFDGSASTIWHTQYTGSAPQPPHEIAIDLGARYAIEGMRYLPRQDSVDHGNVDSYDFYVSDDPMQWGDAATSGSFAPGRNPPAVMFAERSGRYVRFVAKREINGKAYTSMAELDLIGRRL